MCTFPRRRMEGRPLQFSIWPWLIVLVLIGVPVALLLRARRRPRPREKDEQLAGFGGWLLLLAVGLTFGLLRSLADFILSIDLFRTAFHEPDVFAPFILVFFVLVASLLLHLWTLIAMYRKRKLFLRLFPALWGVSGILVLSSFSVLLMPGVTLGHITAGVGQLIAVFIVMGLWVWYLRASVRVKNTFVT